MFTFLVEGKETGLLKALRAPGVVALVRSVSSVDVDMVFQVLLQRKGLTAEFTFKRLQFQMPLKVTLEGELGFITLFTTCDHASDPSRSIFRVYAGPKVGLSELL